MKVICINGVKKGEVPIVGANARDCDVIIEGTEYDTVWSGMVLSSPCYRLAGKPAKTYYRQSRFIPLSQIDERELALSREAVGA